MQITPMSLGKGFPLSRTVSLAPKQDTPAFGSKSNQGGKAKLLPLLLAFLSAAPAVILSGNSGAKATPFRPTASFVASSQSIQGPTSKAEAQKAVNRAENRYRSAELNMLTKATDPFLSKLYGLLDNLEVTFPTLGEAREHYETKKAFRGLMGEKLPQARESLKKAGLSPEFIEKLGEERLPSEKETILLDYKSAVEQANEKAVKLLKMQQERFGMPELIQKAIDGYKRISIQLEPQLQEALRAYLRAIAANGGIGAEE